MDFRTFMYRLKYKLSNLQGFGDYFWLLITVLNAYFLVSAVASANVLSGLLSAGCLYLCLQPLLRR